MLLSQVWKYLYVYIPFSLRKDFANENTNLPSKKKNPLEKTPKDTQTVC